MLFKKKKTFTGDKLKKLLIQREPVLLIDKFCADTDTEAHSGLTVTPDCFFCTDGCLTEPGVTEHIAQSAAAFCASKFIAAGKPTPRGLLGEVKKQRIYALPRCGDVLQTVIRMKAELFFINLITAETKAGDRIIAKCDMKIYMKTI